MSETADITEELLRGCIYSADSRRTRTLLEQYDSAQLKHFQKLLTRIAKEQRELERTDWQASRCVGETLIVAAVLCSDTPAQAAGWLTRRTLFDLFVRGVGGLEDLLLRRHDAEWNRELAMRLSEKLRSNDDIPFWRFVDSLAVSSGARPPITPAYVNGWLLACRDGGWDTQRAKHSISLTQWLREQPRLRECIAGLFTTDGAGSFLTEFPGHVRLDEDKWPKAIARLTAEGKLDRVEVIDGCAARLLRGDRPGSLRGYLDVFEEMAPTRAEVRERLGTYQSLATSAPGTVAKLALRELRALDAEEPFEPLDLATLSEAVLVRPESGLASAQLAWLEAAIKRDSGAAAVLLASFGLAFTHPATSVQQRALKALGKQLKRADPETVSELREAALSVDPALKAEADALFAEFAASDDEGSAAPAGYGLPEYQPAVLPPMPGTPEELVTALAPSYTGGRADPLEAEQIMAAVAVLSHRDLGKLAEVFRPLHDRYDDDRHRKIHASELQHFPEALRCLLEAVLGKDCRAQRVRIDDPRETYPKIAIVLRIQELTDLLLRRKTVPFLLATPTEASGAIDPAVFERRIATYRELGIKPLPLDLEHARLRVAPDAARTKALAELPVADPSLTAAAMGMPEQRSSYPGASRRKSLIGFRPTCTISSLLLPDLIEKNSLILPQPPLGSWNADQQHEFSSIMLPHDPDLVAAYTMTLLYSQANDLGSRTAPLNVFPALAETAGVPGPLTHLALVYALGADRLEHRIAAQDAALTFAARGLLRGDLLGRIAFLAWQWDLLRGKRFIDSLARLEQSGASAQVFETAAAMFGPLSKEPETRGLPELLLLATRCAVGAGIRGVDVPGLAELAGLAKPKRVGVEARRLQDSLGVLNASVTEA